MNLSPELTALRDEAMATSCESWAIQKRWALSRGHDRAGPCPCCGGTDRFSINVPKNVFNCRKCGISGEGVISLVMATEHVEFVRACEIVTGRSAADPVDEQKMAELRRRAEREARARDADAAAYRERARKDAHHHIWKRGIPVDLAGSQIVHDYLERRAIDLGELGPIGVLRAHPELSWTEEWVNPDTGNKGWRTLHTGPAMLAAVQMADGRFGAVHMTWIDLGRDKGKLILPPDETGKPRPSKKVRGIKKGGAIRLFTPPGARRIVMGEGIETTLTPLVHAREPDTAYWAGVDLGNMAGKALRVDGTMIHDQPDLDDVDCFLPPDWCEELVYLGEGDDASVHSREKCLRGLRRALWMRNEACKGQPGLPPLKGTYVPPPGAGEDLNDVAIAELREGDAVA